jgi:hypothetical protein
MKRGALRHPKTDRLMQLLGLRRYQAAGLLESLWQWTGDYAPAGDVGRWNDKSIADGIDWDGDAAQLVDALQQAGFLDPDDRCRLAVHDWWEHAEDAVHMRLARATRYFVDGRRPKLSKLGGKERADLEAKYAVGEAAPALRESVRTDRAHAVRPAGAHPA